MRTEGMGGGEEENGRVGKGGGGGGGRRRFINRQIHPEDDVIAAAQKQTPELRTSKGAPVGRLINPLSYRKTNDNTQTQDQELVQFSRGENGMKLSAPPPPPFPPPPTNGRVLWTQKFNFLLLSEELYESFFLFSLQPVKM